MWSDRAEREAPPLADSEMHQPLELSLNAIPSGKPAGKA